MGIMMVSLAACGDNKEEEKTNAQTDTKTEAKADENGSDAKK